MTVIVDRDQPVEPHVVGNLQKQGILDRDARLAHKPYSYLRTEAAQKQGFHAGKQQPESGATIGLLPHRPPSADTLR